MEDSKEKINRVLIVMDVSNFDYYSIYSASGDWYRYNTDEFNSIVKPKNETDQDNLPNILVSDNFRRILHKTVQKKLESLNWIARNNHQDELNLSEGIDIVFTEDSSLDQNFRKKLYPEYKAQRKLIPKQYNVSVLKEYIQNVIFKELEIEKRYGYKIIKVDGCESDDIIAVLMKKYDNYACRILISSDRDFLQLENVNQYDFGGNRIERIVKGNEDYVLNTKEYLLWKILKGDPSDNIKNVFPRFGDIKSYRLVKDKPTLKKMLSESQEAYNRFKMNKTLIDFREIPPEIEEKIYKAIKTKMDEINVKHEIEEFSLNSCMEI